MNVIEEIVNRTRKTGNTTWILNAAIRSPKCIIVCHNNRYASELEQKYDRIIYERNNTWLMRLINMFKHKKPTVKPKFVGRDFNFIGYRVPVIFDNSALFNIN